jgi:hypothetical protein
MKGIVVAADISQEWMLPWWWNHYRKHNDAPVAFVDLGMSFEKKLWCTERGGHIPLRVVDFAAEESEVDPAISSQWKSDFGKQFWECRNAWFKKPLACLKSPFEQTIWLDLDCEDRGPLAPLFDHSFALAEDQFQHPLDYLTYNSGVIAFSKNHPLLKEWANACIRLHADFRGDQEVLSYLLAEQKAAIDILHPRYNWSRCQAENSDAVVLHWHGAIGKSVIKFQMESQN